jgi:hypothetical protein
LHLIFIWHDKITYSITEKCCAGQPNDLIFINNKQVQIEGSNLLKYKITRDSMSGHQLLLCGIQTASQNKYIYKSKSEMG